MSALDLWANQPYGQGMVSPPKAMPTTHRKTFSELFTTMSGWPDTWMGMPEDLPLGKKLVDEFAPFVEHLANSALKPATIRRHFDNLWVLGGYCVRQASMHDELQRPADELLDEALGPCDGPWIRALTKAEQSSFDATCRKLYQFRSGNTGA